MKYLFPLLALAAAQLARAQVFRLPNTSACQKSKPRPPRSKLLYWNRGRLAELLLYLCKIVNFSTLQGLSTRRGSASPTTSRGWRRAAPPSGAGRGRGTTAGSSAWTRSPSPPRSQLHSYNCFSCTYENIWNKKLITFQWSKSGIFNFQFSRPRPFSEDLYQWLYLIVLQKGPSEGS